MHLGRRQVLLSGAALAAVLTLSACSDAKPDFKGSDISGAKIGQGWTLTDMNGKEVTPALFKDKVSLVFFGYTQCPDICPTALAELTEVMKLLGKKADWVQMVMITVDPERDTQAVMKAYVTGFDPRFIGLTGTVEQVKKAAASYKAYFAKSSKGVDNYTMDHSTMFYLMDTKGEARVLLSNQAGAVNIAGDIEKLLR